MARLVDLRVVLDRSERVAIYCDGRSVLNVLDTSDVSVALADLARRLECLSWSEARTAIEILSDAHSAIFVEVSP